MQYNNYSDSSSSRQTAATLPSLTIWSEAHIRDVFEARSDGACIAAIERTFAPNLVGTVNGKPLNREAIKTLVCAMRASSARGLSVQWQKTSETPRDTSKRDGGFSGAYIIRGLRKQLPGTNNFAEFERHKSVQVTIESISNDMRFDSRLITRLDFKAVDVQVSEYQPRL